MDLLKPKPKESSQGHIGGEDDNPRETIHHIGAQPPIGRENDKRVIVEKLLSNGSGQSGMTEKRDVSIISIVGEGGIGKTTLAKAVFSEVEQQFRERRWWVCVSERPSHRDLSRKILKEVYKGSTAGLEGVFYLSDLCRKLQDELLKKRFLLVLDDVWELDWWQGEVESTLMRGAMGSKILITSRNIDVSKGIRALYMHRLPILQEDKSWNLFLNKALRTENDLASHNLQDIAKKIVKKCGGLPLVVQTVGSLMRTKNMEKAEWKVVADSVIWEWKMPASSSSSAYSPILPGLILSYNDLPHYLRSCFVYCSIFPKDHAIEREGLIMQWVAHGLIEEKEGVGVEVTANQYIEELIKRCLIEETHDTFYRGTYVKLHDILHDLALYISGKEYSHASATEHTRHLSLLGVDDFEVTMQCNPSKANKVRTLLSRECLSSVDFRNFNWLRVLSLRGYWMDELPSYIEFLSLLKYLDLSWSEVRQLPSSIGRFCNLQMLDLSYSKIEELPEEMGELCNLKYLGLERTQSLKFMAEGLGRLTNLWTLHRFLVCNDEGDTRGCNIRELKDLNKLKGKLSIEGLGGGRVKVIDAEKAQLKEKHELIGVKLEFKLRWDYKVDSASEVGEDDIVNSASEVGEHDKVDSAYEVGEDDKVDSAAEVGEDDKVDSASEVGEDDKVDSTSEVGADDKVDSASEQRHLLEALEPPHGIERLGICDYEGDRPVWYLDANYVELRTLQLRRCPLLATVIGIKSLNKLEVYGSTMLKTLANMPALESLKVRDCGSLEQVAEMPALRSLEVGGSTILKTLANMPALVSLKVRDCGSLEQIAEMPALRSLKVYECNMLKTLTNMPPLESLEVGCCDSLEKGAEMPALWSLEVSGCNLLKSLTNILALESLKVVECGSLEQVAEMPALKSLCMFTSNMLKTLANMPALESLEVGGSNMLKILTNMPALESLKVTDCGTLEQVAEMPALKSLSVYRCSMLKTLDNMLALESLGVYGCNMLKTLANMPALESLNVAECDSLEQVAEMPALRSLGVDYGNMPKTLANVPELESLVVRWCDHLEQVAEMPASRSLCMEGCNMLKTLANMPSLGTLTVIECGRLKQVAEMPSLKSLIVFGSNMLKSFANMPTLESLSVTCCDSLEEVAEMPTLRSLEVVECKRLKTLAHMPYLNDLRLDGAKVSTFVPSLKGLSQLEELRLINFNEDISLGGYWQCLPKLKALWVSDFPNLIPQSQVSSGRQ
ncbi:Disease resistance protein [Nymphaea thermarum]|nr:Disease resistance protein [Nymphaea thermarum]